MAGKTGKKQVTLTQALAQFLAKTLLPDLKARAAEPAVDQALQRQWQAEKAANRTADGFPAWQQRTLEQVGAAWVLSCVFVRTLEDRDLLARRRLAGPGALDSEQLFFELAPSLTARDYLLVVFKEVSSLPGAEELLGPRHNPLWRLGPSAEVARALLGFFRQEDAAGAFVWHFDGVDTRFLGDLYQDLSEDVRKRFALLQTPDFVERFILEQTLEPAIAEFGLQTVRVIDPTCGSGHFLLGAFDRLLSHRQQAAPAVDVRDHALAALGQVYGVDVNPYAVAIARFRLTLAYLQRTGITKLAHAPKLPLNLVVADSLLHGGGKGAELLLIEQDRPEIDRVAWQESMFALDDETTGRRILRQRYHVVVGNPPYITCKDSALREAYRERYRSAAGKYALAAPFTERFFELASESGFVGLINANSFMKREFGKTLIEQVLPQFDLTSIIDTSGAYIPGHGTPTVMLFGRNRKSTAANIHAVLGKRGEPSTPENAEQGLVWRSIVDHRMEVGFEDDYVSIAEVPRTTFSKHPWSLGGGGAADLKALLEERAEKTLGEITSALGVMAITGDDEIYIVEDANTLHRWGLSESDYRPLGIGENIRDWSAKYLATIYPHADDGSYRFLPAAEKHFWRFRTNLKNYIFFGKVKEARGMDWRELGAVLKDKLRPPFSIAFPFVATHNNFMLDRGGKVFKQTAPVIKLASSATEEDHLVLLAYLNSSTACFWMKQVVHNKGGEEKATPEAVGGEIHYRIDRGQTGGGGGYEFSSTAIKPLPLPTMSSDDRSVLARLAHSADSAANDRLRAVFDPTLSDSAAHFLFQESTLRLLCFQEEIDWAIYRMFGLHESEMLPNIENRTIPTSRPFEIRLVPAGTTPSVVFDPDGRRIHPELAEVDSDVRRIWTARVGAIARNPDLAVLEDFPYKRRLTILSEFDAKADLDSSRSFEKTRQKVIEERLLQITEDRISTFKNVVRTKDVDPDIERTDRACEYAVPFALAFTLSDTGFEKHRQWRQTWALQRREDLGEAVGEIPVPPKYDQKDFRDANYWRLRGKLDVPKERFISYPGCEKDGDPSPLIGWAGWNHLQRAQALVALYQERKNDDGWPKERLMPMLVGLHELMFWLEQWHNQPEAGSQNPAREFKQFLDAELNAHQLTTDDLEAWRPPARKAAAKRSRKASAETDTP